MVVYGAGMGAIGPWPSEQEFEADSQVCRQLVTALFHRDVSDPIGDADMREALHAP